jgi:hypothetical protein
MTKLRDASKTHLAGVDELFNAQFTEDELAALTELLGRLPTTGAECPDARRAACGPDA